MKNIIFSILIAFLCVNAFCDEKFHKALKTGNIKKLKEMIASDPEILNRTIQGEGYPLDIAVKLGQADVIRLFMEKGVNWGPEPVVDLNDKRSEILLNGLWRFMPVIDGGESLSKQGWGYAWVPDSWTYRWMASRVVAHPSWKSKVNLKNVAKAWYEREFRVPASWKGRALLLDFQRVSTDASVYVNGKLCGEVKWPFGKVDISSAVKFGESNLLRVLVVAVQDAKDVMRFMGPNQISKTKASLASRGIIGDVTLESRPNGGYVADLFVKTSVSDKTLSIDVDLEGHGKGPATFTASIYSQGEKVKEFTKELELAPERKTVELSWSWPDPKLWDFKQPNLYTLQLEVKGTGIDDIYRQRFGFREFKIKGRKFYLNGVEFKIRPNNYMPYYWDANNGLVAEGVMRGFMDTGFNVLEFWPANHDHRGYSEAAARELWVEKADELGFPIIANAMSMSHLVGGKWTDPKIKAEWKKRMETEMRRYRNHPSVIMWVHSANRFGHSDDQNPLRIGKKNWDNLTGDWKSKAKQGDEACAMIKAFDPTRQVMSHECGPVGDVYTLNNYLCIIPLQEREEWLSHWAENGDTPYMAVEFGTPLDCTFSRGRQGGLIAGVDETFYTEMAAIYLGEKAYALESSQLRKNLKDMEAAIAKHKAKGLKPIWHWNWRQMVKNGEIIDSFQELQELFITNTWRSWRAMGLTGGAIPWKIIDFGWKSHPWREEKNAGNRLRSKQIPFVPGTKGSYYPTILNRYLSFLNPDAYERVLKPGKAIKNVNRETLAFIGGAPEWVAKDHHFFEGQPINKQIVLINDSRKTQYYTYEINLSVNDGIVERHSGKGSLKPAETKFIPISFKPQSVATKSSGEFALKARIGEQKHQHRFPIRIYPENKHKELKPVLVFDPEGETLKMMNKLGVKSTKWTGQTGKAGEVLILGRKALAKKLPGDLAKYVKDGGRLVLQGQSPDFLRDKLGLRVSQHVSRRVWPLATQSNHPIVKGLDGEDFRDWNGSGTLKKSYPKALPSHTEMKVIKKHGWHWGNRGSVSSSMIEKPHYSAWTAILEGEFDLAFSPLMELRFGKGLVILNNLDVEGRTEIEPMAKIMMTRILDYASSAKTRNSDVQVVLDGSEDDARLLKEIGINFTRDNLLNPEKLLISTKNGKLDSKVIQKMVSQGGKVIFLGIPNELPFNLKSTNCQGRYSKLSPDPAIAGLSSSDTRLRYDMPLVTMTGPGVKSFGNGLITLFKHDSGGKLWGIAIPPDTLPTKKHPFLRFSNWRATRAFSQILANEGVALLADGKLLGSNSRGLAPISLAGPAEMFVERRVNQDIKTAKESQKDLGLEDVANQAGWVETNLPGPWEKGASSAIDGAIWYRKSVSLPENMRNKRLILKLGPLDDFDTTYVNGVEVGRTGAETVKSYAHPRVYSIPAKLTANENLVIAVRVWDHYGNGGFGARDPKQMRLETKDGLSIPLNGLWKYRIELSLKRAVSLLKPHRDPGVKPEAATWKNIDIDDKGWSNIILPGLFEKTVSNFDGVAWYRFKVKTPAACKGHDMILALGPIADEDILFFNGKQIGESKGRSIARNYKVPADLLRFDKDNEIYVRVVNHRDEGGFLAQASEFQMIVPGVPETAEWYVPGYSDEFWRGDDYTRYFRW